MSEPINKNSLYQLAKELFGLYYQIEEVQDLIENADFENESHFYESMKELGGLLQLTYEIKSLARETKHPAVIGEDQFEYDMVYYDDVTVDVLWNLEDIAQRIVLTLDNARRTKELRVYSKYVVKTKKKEFDKAKKESIENIAVLGPKGFLHTEEGDIIISRINPELLISPLRRLWLDFCYGDCYDEPHKSHIGLILEHFLISASFIAGLYIRENEEFDIPDQEIASIGMSAKEANLKVREIMERESNKGEEAILTLSIRKLAKEIGCSIGLIHKCSAYKILAKTKKGRGKKPTVLRLTDKLQKTTENPSAQTPDELAQSRELEELIKQQVKDAREDKLRSTKSIRPQL